ncbi:acetyltransferase (GNAT) family domain-containing protein [Rhizoctonia solani AG-1 IA]|uniref:Acetyltransferase (GNAT) family domain-containing protein n=1 Tax=Thanatephorus cucumeris (strain AG1-IA) TaxID=983506 RepID=L8WJX5_THACA|nr:acetyltransferase (GNAT) family domain-containing protein [Rhizoctonia solani AG-1 IA]
MATAAAMPIPTPAGATAIPATISSRKTARPAARISLASLTPNNLGTLRKLNSVLFPIRYSEKFYKEVLEPELDEFFYYNDVPVGAVCSRIERGRMPGEACVYIMTMGVLAVRIFLYLDFLERLCDSPYRGLGLGSMALQQVFNAAAQYNGSIGDKPPIGTPPQSSTISFNALNRKITSFYLHVHVPNTDARTFYERYGFVERERIAGYYRKLGSSDGPERDAWVLERPVTTETNGTD